MNRRYTFVLYVHQNTRAAQCLFYAAYGTIPARQVQAENDEDADFAHLPQAPVAMRFLCIGFDVRG